MENETSTTIKMVETNQNRYLASLLAAYDFNKLVDRLKFFHKQLANPQETAEEQSELYLLAGCTMFGADVGFIVSSLGSVYRNINAYDARNKELRTNLTEDEEKLYRYVFSQDNACRSSHVVSDHWDSSGDSSYGEKATSGYNHPEQVHILGTPLYITGNKCGVLCFLTSTGFESSVQDEESLELMAEGVARMIELQSAQAKNRIEDIRGLSAGGVRSLDEYINDAKLPEAYGVSGRVVDVLERRIGTMPLAIDYIASELNLSKRTLQRRLQQQNVSFAQLRDQVRFHHSIDYLIHQSLSIDAISAALDFSDRTSFTNAFKRWTSLSPSTFRKLFRDYA